MGRRAATSIRQIERPLTKNHVMSYFNPRLKTEVMVDASPVGLLLAQDGKVISYASRALSDVEHRYSQTEREMLGVVWAAEHFHLYLYGSEFTIATDHKPLLGIFNSHKPTSARIDRWKLIREKVWFPGVDMMVKEKVDSCLPCQEETTCKAQRLEPLRMTPLPTAPWKELAMDFLGPLPSGDCLMVVIDEYSRFPEVEIVTSTSARSTIPKLDAIFARQGIPEVLKSDNGPPFNGVEVKNVAEHLGFQHRKITPLWPRANGEAERFMMTLEKCVRTATIEHNNWKQELNKFLRQYRATPHSTTGISPYEALNQRKLKTTLPEVTPPVRQQTIVETQNNLAQRDAEQKKKIKAYADQKLGVRESNIKLGDTVLVKQPKANKLSTPFNPVPLVVEEKQGSMITASDGHKTVTRNSSMFKVVPSHIEHTGNHTQEMNEDVSANPQPLEIQELDKITKSSSPFFFFFFFVIYLT